MSINRPSINIVATYSARAAEAVVVLGFIALVAACFGLVVHHG